MSLGRASRTSCRLVGVAEISACARAAQWVITMGLRRSKGHATAIPHPGYLIIGSRFGFARPVTSVGSSP